MDKDSSDEEVVVEGVFDMAVLSKPNSVLCVSSEKADEFLAKKNTGAMKKIKDRAKLLNVNTKRK